jgi:5-methylcytosine-specific restriction endonuclease McrA
MSQADNLKTTLITMLMADHQDGLAVDLLHASIEHIRFEDGEEGWIIEIPVHSWKHWKNDTKKQDIVRTYFLDLLRDIRKYHPEVLLDFRLKLEEYTEEWQEGMRSWFADKLILNIQESMQADPDGNADAFDEWINKSFQQPQQETQDFSVDHPQCAQRIAALEEQLARQEAERLIIEAQAQAARTNYQETLQELECSQALLQWYQSRQERCSEYMRQKALEYAGYTCMMNDEHTENLQIDRVIPHTRGGKYTWDNIQVLCQLCNKVKNTHTGQGWDYRTAAFQDLCQRELAQLNAQENLFPDDTSHP